MKVRVKHKPHPCFDFKSWNTYQDSCTVVLYYITINECLYISKSRHCSKPWYKLCNCAASCCLVCMCPVSSIVLIVEIIFPRLHAGINISGTRESSSGRPHNQYRRHSCNMVQRTVYMQPFMYLLISMYLKYIPAPTSVQERTRSVRSREQKLESGICEAVGTCQRHLAVTHQPDEESLRQLVLKWLVTNT
jgi:hypothetical protein